MKTQAGLIQIAAVLMLVSCNPQSEQKAGWVLQGTWIDLTYSFSDETIYWPTADGFMMDTVFFGKTEAGYFYSAFNFAASEHGGTHLDAPIHFADGKKAVDELAIQDLVGSGIVVDVSKRALENRDYLISVADFEAWEQEHGQIPEGTIVLLRTGYGQFWPDKLQYMGTEMTGVEAAALLHFPGLAPEAARWLVENRTIKAIGIDTPSIDYGQSSMFEAHRMLCAKNIPGFENVANLDQLPPKGFHVFAFPMKIAGGSGGPLRIAALVHEGE